MALRFGRHVDAGWQVQWSGVRVAVADLADVEGVVALTALVLKPSQEQPS